MTRMNGTSLTSWDEQRGPLFDPKSGEPYHFVCAECGNVYPVAEAEQGWRCKRCNYRHTQ